MRSSSDCATKIDEIKELTELCYGDFRLNLRPSRRKNSDKETTELSPRQSIKNIFRDITRSAFQSRLRLEFLQITGLQLLITAYQHEC